MKTITDYKPLNLKKTVTLTLTIRRSVHISVILLATFSSFSVVLTETEPKSTDDGKEEVNKRMDLMNFEEYNENCETSFDLSTRPEIVISTPETRGGTYLPGVSCAWLILGHKDCLPMLTCQTFDIRKFGKNCDEEFLEISDGLGGNIKLCGKDGHNNAYRPSQYSFDLIVSMNTSERTDFGRHYDGFKCVATCYKLTVTFPKPGDSKLIRLPILRKGISHIHKKCECGVRKRGRIVGGKDAFLNEYPWQAAMVDKGTRNLKCGASLINDRFILTAAHCVVVSPTDVLGAEEIDILLHANVLDMVLKGKKARNVTLGKKGSILTPGHDLPDTTDADENTIRAVVADILVHPAYNTTSLDYDIALLHLEEPVDLASKTAPVVPICLPDVRSHFDGSGDGHEKMSVVGWGLAHEKAGGSTRKLQYTYVPYVKRDLCQAKMKMSFTDRMICGGYTDGHRDACTGDSGGPLFFEGQKRDQPGFQHGIVSFGEGCGRAGGVGVFTKVSVLLPWIYHNTPNSIWCERKGPERKKHHAKKGGKGPTITGPIPKKPSHKIVPKKLG